MYVIYLRPINIGGPYNQVSCGTHSLIYFSNECIYCENVFCDRNALMEHMRRRNHREVNPKNDYYDKFYIINYLVSVFHQQILEFFTKFFRGKWSAVNGC